MLKPPGHKLKGGFMLCDFNGIVFGNGGEFDVKSLLL